MSGAMSRTAFALVALVIAAAGAQVKSRRPAPSLKMKFALDLPHNATSIRENIVDNFSCENRIYGYYADIDNDCQIFHICLPQARNTIRFSFICPGETVFNQATFVCTRTESSIPCEDSTKYYELNEELGKVEESTEDFDKDTESTSSPEKPVVIKPTIKPNVEVHELPRPIQGKRGRH